MRFILASLLLAACSFTGEPGAQVDSGQADASPDGAGADAPIPLSCGDQDLDIDEQCDDGNLEPGDGCDAACLIEPGFQCPQGASCVEVDDLQWSNAPVESATTLGDSGGGGLFLRQCLDGEIGLAFEGIHGSDCGGAGGGVARVQLRCGDIDFDAAGVATTASSYLTNEVGVCSPAGTITAGMINCPAGDVLVGVRGSTNGFLGRLEGICRPLTLLGGELGLGDSENATGTLGPGAASSTVECPAGQLVVGIGGNVGQVIDHLSIFCAAIESM